jgi:hypothetical protein
MARAMRRPTTLLCAALGILSGCACDTVPPEALENCSQSAVLGGKVDILFVIDDSASMKEEQQALSAALTRFIQTLRSSPATEDYQIGVTNTSVAEYGGGESYRSTYVSPPYLATTPPFPPGTPYPRGVITAIDASVDPALTDYATWGDYVWSSAEGFGGPRLLRWDDANLETEFRRNVLVGTWGSAREQPFRALELAIGDQAAPGKQNEGFLRPGARLAIFFLSDEDDCSGPQSDAITADEHCRDQRTATPSLLTPVSHFASLLQGPIAGEQRDVVVGAVVGVTCTGGLCTNTKCSTALTDPPANRYLELLSGLDPTRTALASICDANFDAALDQFAHALMSQTVPLSGGVADPHMLAVQVTKADGVRSCTVAETGTAAAAAADALYAPPRSGAGATLTFQNGCTLGPGDRIDVHVICAG